MSVKPTPAEALPDGWTILPIDFVSEATPDQKVILRLPPPIHGCAVLRDRDRGYKNSPEKAILPGLEVLFAWGDDTEKMKSWVEQDNTPSTTIVLQGAQIVWAYGRVAVKAVPERLDSLRDTIVECYFYQSELLAIESQLGTLWPHLEDDAPLAFEFEDKSIPRRQQLAERFQQIMMLRARLARIAPHVHGPHLHPPTLASQLNERIRERLRMPHRLDSLGTQLEVFERIYESCGQRASDYRLARKGHTLEWVIILLLFTQTLMVLFEIMTVTGK